MSDVAQIVVPIAAGGTGAVLAGMAEEAGSELYRACTRLLDRVRALGGRTDEVPAVEQALEEGLRRGLISEDDLRAVVTAHAEASTSYHFQSSVTAKNAFFGTTTIGTFNG